MQHFPAIGQETHFLDSHIDSHFPLSGVAIQRLSELLGQLNNMDIICYPDRSQMILCLTAGLSLQSNDLFKHTPGIICTNSATSIFSLTNELGEGSNLGMQASLETMGMDAKLAVDRARSRSASRKGRKRDRSQGQADMEVEEEVAVPPKRVHSGRSR